VVNIRAQTTRTSIPSRSARYKDRVCLKMLKFPNFILGLGQLLYIPRWSRIKRESLGLICETSTYAFAAILDAQECTSSRWSSWTSDGVSKSQENESQRKDSVEI